MNFLDMNFKVSKFFVADFTQNVAYGIDMDLDGESPSSYNITPETLKGALWKARENFQYIPLFFGLQELLISGFEDSYLFTGESEYAPWEEEEVNAMFLVLLKKLIEDYPPLAKPWPLNIQLTESPLEEYKFYWQDALSSGEFDSIIEQIKE